MTKIRAMLVDDHILMRMGVISATQVEPDIEIVAEAEDAEEAMRAYALHRPDLVILDLRMPKVDGIELAATLQREFGFVRILILSNYSAGDDIARAFQAGASGYVAKGMPRKHLIDAIRVVASGEQYMPDELAGRYARRIQSQLSDREAEVLKLIAKGLSNKEIASALGIVEGTVKIHVANILSKLRVADRTQAVVAAVKRNILELE